MGMTRIWDRLYLGSLEDAAQLAAENPFGITSVVSLCSHKVPHKASGVSYAHVPIADSRPISARQFDAVMAAIAHCVGGMGRSPIMMAAPMRMPQPRRGAARNSGVSSDHRPVPRITAKFSGAPRR